MRAALCVVLCALGALLAACGTFQLGRVQPQSGKTAEQQQLDTLTCKDQARLAAESAGQQTKEFLLGLTIIGTPVAYESDKAKQREVFTTCMRSKGYAVLRPLDDTLPSVATDKAPGSVVPATPAVPGLDSLHMYWPAGFEERALTDAQRRTGMVALAINRAADVGVSVVADRHGGVTDVSTYAVSKRAGWLSRLGDGTATDITVTEIGGRKAFRCEGGGFLKEIHLRGIETIIEGNDQIITVLTWTSDANWSNQADMMRTLPAKVTGVQ